MKLFEESACDLAWARPCQRDSPGRGAQGSVANGMFGVLSASFHSYLVRWPPRLVGRSTIAARYQTWCKDTGVTKSQEIKTAAGQIERLTAEIQKHEAAAVDLTDKVAVLDADIAGSAAPACSPRL